MNKSRRAFSTRMRKVMYLVNHAELLTATRVQIANALKSAGLVSPLTSPVDLCPSQLKEEARRIIAERAAS